MDNKICTIANTLNQFLDENNDNFTGVEIIVFDMLNNPILYHNMLRKFSDHKRIHFLRGTMNKNKGMVLMEIFARDFSVILSFYP